MVAKARAWLSLLYSQSRETIKPVVANLFLTGRCNANCRYCYVDRTYAPESELSVDQWLTLIDELAVSGTRIVSLVGGEPLLFDGVDRILDRLRSHGIYTVLTSNGALVKRNLHLAEKASILSISLDGPQACNDEIRGDGAYTMAVEAVETLRQHQRPVRISTVVSNRNVDQIPFLVDFCQRHGATITFTPCINPPEVRASGTKSLKCSDDELRAFFVELKAWKSKTEVILNSLRSIEYMIGYPTSFERIVNKEEPEASYYTTPCPYGRFQFLISQNGDVYPCGNWWNSVDFTPRNIADGLSAACRAASEIPCQYCSFCNLVDWNELASLRGILTGLNQHLR